MDMKRVKRLGTLISLGFMLSLSGCGLQNFNVHNLTSNPSLSHIIKNIKQSETTKPNSPVNTSTEKIQSQIASADSQPSGNKRVSIKSPTVPQTISKASTSSDTLSKAAIGPSNSVLSLIEHYLKNQATTFSVPVPTTGTIGKLFKKAMAEDPYNEWIIASYDVSSNGTVADINVTYRETKQETDYVNAHAKQILSSILKPDMTNVYKEYLIHNWIVSHVQYDNSLQNDTAYDALKYGRAVCQGYALLAYRMLTDAGIPTKIETGYANGESHMWNEVSIDGQWEQLDPTWDDPVGDAPSDISYAYFNVTNQALAASHQWKENNFPVAKVDVVSQLKALINSDPQHKSEYNTILNAIGASLPIEETPQTAHQLLQNALQEKKSSIDFIIHTTQANSSSFMDQADHNLISTTPVSLEYTAPTYVRKGQDYCRVHLTFNYSS